MFALPEQTMSGCEADVASALSFGAPHLSFYQLTLEPNTLVHRHPPRLPDEDLAADMQQAIEDRLAGAGYTRYEVSAYARAGRTCAHNLNYWRFGDYLGIGAGAHAKLSFPDRVVREIRFRQPRQYMEKVAAESGVMERREVSRDEIGFEFMLNALRLTEGVASATFVERTGFPLAIVAAAIDEGVSRGLLVADPTRIAATALGRRFLNRTLELFLAARSNRHVTPLPISS
jgi:oxygen-independent coproporphyrinogen-3 oxidase